MTTRASRDTETRETSQRKKAWAPASRVPSPSKEDGYSYRWVRTATLGQADNTNVSAKFREGWEPVRADEHPELMVQSDIDSRFEGNVEVGGLLLCKNSKENVESRKDYYAEMNRRQIESVDNNFMRENDPRMPLLRPEKRTKVSFGSGD